MMDSWEEIVNSQKTQAMNQTKFCPVQDQVLSNIKICQNPIMPDEGEGFNSLVIYFFFPVLALTAILLVSLSLSYLPIYAVPFFNRFKHPPHPPPAPQPPPHHRPLSIRIP